MGICGRCEKDTKVLTGSYFDTEMICLECNAAERAHPAFEAARRVEAVAVRKGDMNFAGVGLPDDLRRDGR